MDSKSNSDYITEAGFFPPITYFSKPDPRGFEYGSFRVSFIGNVFIVTKMDELDVRVYSMSFTNVTDFMNWAKDCT